MIAGPIKASKEEFEKFQEFIQKRIGIKFPETKKTLLESRLSTHIQKLGFNNYNDYLDYIYKQPDFSDEIDYLVDKITTHTTYFFREPYHFDFLINKGINIIHSNFGKETIKIISLGSSTGEEMYTIAMIMYDLKKQNIISDYLIDGADISKYALLKAKEGVFKIDHYESIPDKYKKLFIKKDNKLYAVPEIKKNLRFFIINITNPKQKFPANYHIVFCRNTLIYFDKILQQNVINNVQKILYNKGIFITGHSESLHGLSHSFKRIEPTIYQFDYN